MKHSLAAIATSLTLGFSLSAWAADVPPEWKDCEKEIGKFCKGVTESKAIFECIERREKLGKKSGLSKKCNDAHEKQETPEQEQNEKQQGGEAK